MMVRNGCKGATSNNNPCFSGLQMIAVYLISCNIFLGLHRMEPCRIWNPESVPFICPPSIAPILEEDDRLTNNFIRKFHQEWKFHPRCSGCWSLQATRLSLPKVPSSTWQNSCMLGDSRKGGLKSTNRMDEGGRNQQILFFHQQNPNKSNNHDCSLQSSGRFPLNHDSGRMSSKM